MTDNNSKLGNYVSPSPDKDEKSNVMDIDTPQTQKFLLTDRKTYTSMSSSQDFRQQELGTRSSIERIPLKLFTKNNISTILEQSE